MCFDIIQLTGFCVHSRSDQDNKYFYLCQYRTNLRVEGILCYSMHAYTYMHLYIMCAVHEQTTISHVVTQYD